MNEQAKKATKRTRRWLKVSLRTFLLAITVLCVWLGFIVNRANKQKQAVAWVRECGGRVYYDFEFDDETGEVIEDAEPPGPDWLWERIGLDYCADVHYVNLFCKQKITDIAPLASLPDMRRLTLTNTPVSDLSPLAGLVRMETLNLAYTRVSDLSPLAGMTRMESLDLNGTSVSDLTPISRMNSLESLNVGDTQITDLSPLAKMKQMRKLDLFSTAVSDLSSLDEMNQMEKLELYGTQVSDLAPLLEMKQVQISLGKYQKISIPPELETRVNRH